MALDEQVKVYIKRVQKKNLEVMDAQSLYSIGCLTSTGKIRVDEQLIFCKMSIYYFSKL